MIDKLMDLLTSNGVSEDMINTIKEELGDGFQVSDIMTVLNKHKGDIANADAIMEKIPGLAGDGLMDKAKGMLGM